LIDMLHLHIFGDELLELVVGQDLLLI